MSSADILVYDMANAPSQTTNVFVKKDYFSIQDDQGSAGYSGNQSILQLSALANSNRYMDFKNCYLTVPMVMTLTASAVGTAFQPIQNNNNFAVGLRSWFGHVIHSIGVDFNNSTAQQITSFQSLINCFKLHTTLSWDDVASIGSSIGYYPDGTSWGYKSSTRGLENNRNLLSVTQTDGNRMCNGNKGLYERQRAIAYDPSVATAIDGGVGDTFATLCSATNATNMYRSHVYKKTDGAVAVVGVLQYAITAKIMGKHLSDFLAKLPLVKGAFLKITMNLNQPVVDFTVASSLISAQSVNSPLGGVNPLQIAAITDGIGGLADATYKLSLGVGKEPPAWANHLGTLQSSPLASNVEIHVPAVVFAPVFEAAYNSQSIKRFQYEDYYNYNVINRVGGSRIVELLTNGVKNQTRLVVMPFLTAASNGGVAPIQSALTSDGATCSPVALNDFNVLLSGASLLQSNYRYSYQMFMEQLRGSGAINGGMTDGFTSGIIDQTAFENNYGYMVVDTSRMLDIEKEIPKSVQLLTQIQAPSGVSVDLYTFICYSQDFAVDVLVGARV
jgi:hypothetical protein